jgi:glycerol-3-phosphate dehydrogenase
LAARGELSPAAREEALRELAGAGPGLDVLVLGGGATGSGTALDAASRGLRTGLIEAGDLAGGTSSKSSKLFHGGLRYLEMFDFGLVREALRERDLMLTRLAPHLVRPVPFLFPFTHRLWERPYVGAGLLLYDRMGGGRNVPRARQLSRTAASREAPSMRPDRLIGAARFYDAVSDDARLVTTVARTAAAAGAAIATRVRADSLLREGERVVGVVATDLETGGRLEVRARVVISALGPWTTAELAGQIDGVPTIRPSKGIHIVIARDRLKLDAGVFARTEKSVLFVIPWGHSWLIGDTDTDWRGPISTPLANRGDVDYLLEKCNQWFEAGLTRDDVLGTTAGLRPLVAADPDASTENLSRVHLVASPAPGLITATGGKYTIYRVMAKDAVDAAARRLGGSVPPSRTAEHPLLGALGYPRLRDAAGALAADSGLPAGQIERLLGRYGDGIEEILALIAADPALGAELPDGAPYLGAEVVFACTHEGARRVEDVLERRTRLAIEVGDRGLASAPAAVALMAAPLGWDGARQAAEIVAYRRRVAALRAAEEAPDDGVALTEYERVMATDTDRSD